MPRLRTSVALVASTAAAGLAGAAIAGAADSATGTTPSGPAATTPGGKGDHHRGPGGPGRGIGGHHGAGGPGARADLAAVAKALGVTEDTLKAAVDAARPTPPAPSGTTPPPARGKADRRDDDIAAVAKALGESEADVKAVFEAERGTHKPGDRKPGDRKPGDHRPGTRGGDPDGLATALAKKFSISETKAKEALEAAHKVREAAREAEQDKRFAAIAKTLGKDTAEVKKAFEDNRPAPPTKPATPTP